MQAVCESRTRHANPIQPGLAETLHSLTDKPLDGSQGVGIQPFDGCQSQRFPLGIYYDYRFHLLSSIELEVSEHGLEGEDPLLEL